ncbi:MAG: M23 family metallopeptidase [Acetobacteraceae bacterium]|nr:M23 family metallopeptidase [Acetobacteraceae bacterium]
MRVPRRALLALPGLLHASPGRAVTLPESSSQGAYLVGRDAVGAALSLDGRALRVSPSGRFALAFHREHGPEARLLIRRDGRSEMRLIRVAPRAWDIQRITGLPPAMVTPDAEALARIRAEAARVAEIRRQDRPAEGFAEPLLWPAEGRISGVFGSQRILNGEPRAPHLGIDIAVPTGTPVRAALPGRVVLAEDLYFNGLTVILDHGHGVTTTYSHLSAFRIREGADLAQGEVLGLSGATGRVTGPHLDFRLHWFERAADPLPLLPPR